MRKPQVVQIIEVVQSSIDRVRNRNMWEHVRGNLIWTGKDAKTQDVENIDPRSILDSLSRYLAGVAPELSINDIATQIGDWGRRKGWTFTEQDIPQKLMLVVTELAEAMEEFRKPEFNPAHVYFNQDAQGEMKPEGFGIELADAIIRLLHLAEHLQLDMNDLIAVKMTYNESRPYKHGKTA